MKLISIKHWVLAAVVPGIFAGTQPILADSQERTESWAITEGGKLYDNWAKVLYYDTKDLPTHPAYPAASKQKSASTWRCKECHGWDYKGRDGAYARGSHYTGIKGLREMVGAAPERIAGTVRDKPHGYTEQMLPNQALSALALFVSRGQLDMDQYIDRAAKSARGDSKRGARFYQTVCAICHGFDGRQVNFKTPENPEYIGTVASDNPWETLHKIRNGQPGVPMVSLGVLDIQDQVDILAYCQTLPVK